MGIRLFGSSSSYDKCDCTKIAKDDSAYIKGNPVASNFKIVGHHQCLNNLVVKINYPDCTNYEGNKILLYLDTTIDDINKQKYIDPHFSWNKKFLCPFARFEPTKKGWYSAIKLGYIEGDEKRGKYKI